MSARFVGLACSVLSALCASLGAQEGQIVVFDKSFSRDMGPDAVVDAMGLAPEWRDEVKGIYFLRPFQRLENAKETAHFVFNDQGQIIEVVWEVSRLESGAVEREAAAQVFGALLEELRERYGEPGYQDVEEGRYGAYIWNFGEGERTQVKFDFWLNEDDSGAKISYDLQ